jgi:hypothetical protein
MVRKGNRGESERKINTGKMMLAKIEGLEQKKDIMLNKSKLKERKDERMYIDDYLANEERKKGKNRIQEDTDKRGMVHMGWERRQTEEKFLEEGDKNRRLTVEKRFKEKVNKKVDGQRKQKSEKKHKEESRYRKSTNGKITEQKEKRKREEGEEEGCMETKVHIGNKWCKIITMNSKEMKTTRRRVDDAMKENREDCILLGGDFNGRIGERGARNWKEERGMEKKNPKSRWKMKRGRENWWEVLNGNKQEDEEVEWTYIGSREETVIDYGIVNEEAWKRVEEFRIGERVESDHLQIALRKRRGGKEQKRKGWGMGITLFIFLELLFYV